MTYTTEAAKATRPWRHAGVCTATTATHATHTPHAARARTDTWVAGVVDPGGRVALVDTGRGERGSGESRVRQGMTPVAAVAVCGREKVGGRSGGSQVWRRGVGGWEAGHEGGGRG